MPVPIVTPPPYGHAGSRRRRAPYLPNPTDALAHIPLSPLPYAHVLTERPLPPHSLSLRMRPRRRRRRVRPLGDPHPPRRRSGRRVLAPQDVLRLSGPKEPADPSSKTD